MNNSKFQIPKCKNFTGYKPCFPYYNCLEQGCKEENSIGKKILIINLDAMGDVIMTTAQLAGIKRKYPLSTIYWITLKNAYPLLINNPLIDFPMEWNLDNILILQNMEFDIVLNADKSLRSCSLHKSIKAKEKYGFTINEDGKIAPENAFADYNYLLGLDDHLKFRVNQKTGQEILAETWNNDYRGDKYILNLTEDEKDFVRKYREQIIGSPNQTIIGFNTGCSNLYPNKKMTIEQHVYLINELSKNKEYKLLLLGGPEDTERNAKIKELVGEKAISTPTNEGLRRGLCYIDACDVVITGDSFGMHASIALGKYVIVWFGVSCWTEIDLYDYGKKFYQENLSCSPCWKRSCPYNLECISGIDLDGMIKEVHKFHNEIKRTK